MVKQWQGIRGPILIWAKCCPVASHAILNSFLKGKVQHCNNLYCLKKGEGVVVQYAKPALGKPGNAHPGRQIMDQVLGSLALMGETGLSSRLSDSS